MATSLSCHTCRTPLTAVTDEITINKYTLLHEWSSFFFHRESCAAKKKDVHLACLTYIAFRCSKQPLSGNAFYRASSEDDRMHV